MGKNVAIFVDVANIFYAAKAAGVDIDYVTLLKSAIAGRDFVRAYAYTGLDPDNENQRNFHAFLARHNYKVVSKDIRKYGDGKVKANLDIELVVDMMKTARNLDVAIVVSGDGDFAPAIRAVQEMGVRCEVISFRGNTSSDLIEVADLFTDITQIAKVEKGSSRSGRRVADDEEDLSMTEVPDKQTEGTGVGRGRGTRGGRTRRTSEAEPVAAGSRSIDARPAARAGRRPVEPAVADAAAVPALPAGQAHGGGLVALPGEKLSKAAVAAAARTSRPTSAPAPSDFDDESEEPDEVVEAAPVDSTPVDPESEEGQRRRRRRGGRGRGRGRGRNDAAGLPDDAPRETVATPLGAAGLDDDEDDEEDLPVAPRPPRSAAFGSVWDSQIGMDRAPAANLSAVDIDDEDEPAIPEYLIAEQRRGNRPIGRDGRPQGGVANRGGRGGGYSAAVDRERFGRGGGGGINRYPDVSGRRLEERPRSPERPRTDDRSRTDDRPPAAARQDRPRSGDEPWSEVPPELEAMLRAQLAAKPARPAEVRGPDRSRAATVAPLAAESAQTAETAEAAVRPARRGRPARAVDAEAAAKPTAGSAADVDAEAAGPAPRRRVTSRRAAEPVEPITADAASASPAPRRRAPGRTPAAAVAADVAVPEAAGTAAPAARRRTARTPAAVESTPVADAAASTATPVAAPARKPRAPRKVAD